MRLAELMVEWEVHHVFKVDNMAADWLMGLATVVWVSLLGPAHALKNSSCISSCPRREDCWQSGEREAPAVAGVSVGAGMLSRGIP